MDSFYIENKRDLENLQPKQSLLTISFGPIKQADMVRYAGASGDFNPIHNDLPFAQSVGLQGTIVFGMYTMALMARTLNKCVAQNKVKTFKAKFKDIVYVNDIIDCEAIIKRILVNEGKICITLNAMVDEKVKASADADVFISD